MDEPEKFDVTTLLEGAEADKQTVTEMSGLLDNSYLVWKKTAALEATAGMPLTGGTNNDNITGEHQAFLDKVESFSFHTLGCPSPTAAIANLYIAFTKRMRDEVGVKFQTVVYNRPGDYEGVINVGNKVLDGDNEAALVYWVAGASAGCQVHRSNTNRVYDGEYIVHVDMKQRDIEDALDNGVFLFHKVGDDVRVLEDINSLVQTAAEKGEDFKMNQVIRVLDQIGNDVAAVFNTKYLGQYPNNASGRVSLWSDIVKLHKNLLELEAIQDFNPEDDIVVEQGM